MFRRKKRPDFPKELNLLQKRVSMPLNTGEAKQWCSVQFSSFKKMGCNCLEVAEIVQAVFTCLCHHLSREQSLCNALACPTALTQSQPIGQSVDQRCGARSQKTKLIQQWVSEKCGTFDKAAKYRDPSPHDPQITQNPKRTKRQNKRPNPKRNDDRASNLVGLLAADSGNEPGRLWISELMAYRV